jgi:hypothetical protein
MEVELTPKYVWNPRGLRVPILAKSRSIGSDSFSGSVGDRHTILLIELYARNRLSGLSDASVIVHCP